MEALILEVIRMSCRLEKADTQHIIFNVMAVFAVVEKADAVISLGKVRPAVGNALESCLIPACIPVVRTSYITVLDIIGCIGLPDVHREGSLQKLVLFMVINSCLKINPA